MRVGNPSSHGADAFCEEEYCWAAKPNDRLDGSSHRRGWAIRPRMGKMAHPGIMCIGLGDGNVWARIGRSAWGEAHRQSGHVRPGCVRTRGLHGAVTRQKEGGEKALPTLGDDRGAAPGVCPSDVGLAGGAGGWPGVCLWSGDLAVPEAFVSDSAVSMGRRPERGTIRPPGYQMLKPGGSVALDYGVPCFLAELWFEEE
jgi:hypothetical protein